MKTSFALTEGQISQLMPMIDKLGETIASGGTCAILAQVIVTNDAEYSRLSCKLIDSKQAAHIQQAMGVAIGTVYRDRPDSTASAGAGEDDG